MRGDGLLDDIMSIVIPITILLGVVYFTLPAGEEAMQTAEAKIEQQKAEQRFVWAEGNTGNSDIIIDRETGVCYLWHSGGYKGGLTVLVDADGKPIIWEEGTP